MLCILLPYLLVLATLSAVETLQPITLCSSATQQQHTVADKSGVIQYNPIDSTATVNCSLTLIGFTNNSRIAIMNVVGATDESCNADGSLYINDEEYCVSTDQSDQWLEVFLTGDSGSIIIQIRQFFTAYFELQYYEGISFCERSEDVIIDRDTTAAVLIPSPQQDFCIKEIANPLELPIKFSLIVPHRWPYDFLDDIEIGFRPADGDNYNLRRRSGQYITKADQITLHYRDHYGFRGEESRLRFAVRYEVLTCEDEPPQMVNGDYAQLPPPPWHVNTTIYYKCETGYQSNLSHPANSMCEQNGQSTVWTGPEDICVPVPCTAWPLEISNGQAVLATRNHTYVYLDTVRYECEEGFTLYRENVTCQSDGTWSPTPMCLPQVSSDPVSKSGGENAQNQERTTTILAAGLGLTVFITASFILCALVTNKRQMWSWQRKSTNKPISVNSRNDDSDGDPMYVNLAVINKTRIGAASGCEQSKHYQRKDRSREPVKLYEESKVQLDEQHTYESVKY